MLARTPFTEVEIEGVGPYRLPNDWQYMRLRRFKGYARHIAMLAFGCGMTVRQFHKLPIDKQQEVHRAYLALTSPSFGQPKPEPDPNMLVLPRGHLSRKQKLRIGQWLNAKKASLPHGHFGPWLEKQEGLSRGMSQQCMALAREDAAHRAQQATGTHREVIGASAV